MNAQQYYNRNRKNQYVMVYCAWGIIILIIIILALYNKYNKMFPDSLPGNDTIKEQNIHLTTKESTPQFKFNDYVSDKLPTA